MPGRQDVRVERARVWKPDGSVVDTHQEADRSTSEPWYRLYYDTRVRQVVIPALAPGDVLELSWRVDDVAPENLLSDYFGEVVPFVDTARKERMDYVLLAPASRPIHASDPALPGVSRSVKDLAGGLREYRWTATDLPRLVPEPGMPGTPSPPPRSTSPPTPPGTRWPASTRGWCGSSCDPAPASAPRRPASWPRCGPGPGAPAWASRRSAGRSSRRSTTRWSRSTRYVGLEFGIHGFKPYPVEQVLTRRFGDCKDKASLMHALLEAAGIDSRIVLLRMRRLGNLPPAPASLAVFNHAILYVPEFDLWLDGTATGSGSRELPAEDRGATVLVVNPGAPPTFRTIPEAVPGDDRVVTEVRGALAADGSATAEGSIAVAGVQAPDFRRGYRSESGRRAALERSFARTFPGLRVESVETSDLSRIEDDVTVRFRVAVPRLARPENGGLALAPFGQGQNWMEIWAPSSTRQHDLVLPSPFESRFTLRWEMPAGMAPSALPAPERREGPFGSWSVSLRMEGGALVAQGSLRDHVATHLRRRLPGLPGIPRRGGSRAPPHRPARAHRREEAVIRIRRAAPALLLLARWWPAFRPAPSSVAGPSGFDAWLAHGDPAAASVRFRADAVRDPSDPWPLLGEAMLAERSLDEDAEAGALLALVAAAPRHPLALVALRRLGELSLASPPVADRVDEALARALGGSNLPGTAAYRARVVRAAIAEMRGAYPEAAGMRARNGVANAWTLAGPFGAYHALELDRPFPPEQGAWPPPGARTLPAPDGAFSLDGESVPGDVWYVAADAVLARGGRYLLAVGTTASIRVFLDGKPVAERRAWAGWPSAVQLAKVELSPGTHRFLVKLTRGAGRANLALTLARDDGSDADVTWAAATGPGPAVTSGELLPTVLGARALAEALEPEGGPVLSRLVAARDRAENDRQAALSLLDEAAGLAPAAAPVRAARGDTLVGDPTLAERTAQGKAEAEWQEAARIDPGSAATRLLLAEVATAGGRLDDAEALLAALPEKAAARPRARLVRARLLAARSHPEAAESLVLEASRAGSCARHGHARRDGLAARRDRARGRGRPGRWPVPRRGGTARRAPVPPRGPARGRRRVERDRARRPGAD